MMLSCAGDGGGVDSDAVCTSMSPVALFCGRMMESDLPVGLGFSGVTGDSALSLLAPSGR